MEESLTMEEIKQRFLVDLKESLSRKEDLFQDHRKADRVWACSSEQQDFDKSEIIWESSNSVLFVFPSGDDLYLTFVNLIRDCSDLVWMTHITLYEGRLAVRVILVDAYIPGNPTRN